MDVNDDCELDRWENEGGNTCSDPIDENVFFIKPEDETLFELLAKKYGVPGVAAIDIDEWSCLCSTSSSGEILSPIDIPNRKENGTIMSNDPNTTAPVSTPDEESLEQLEQLLGGELPDGGDSGDDDVPGEPDGDTDDGED